MPREHNWVLDTETSMDMNQKCTGNMFDSRYLVARCSICGCIRVTDNEKFALEGCQVYKPNEWTWNPFKVLKEEPTCPAHW